MLTASERGEAGVQESFHTLLIDSFNQEGVPCTLAISAKWYRPKKQMERGIRGSQFSKDRV